MRWLCKRLTSSRLARLAFAVLVISAQILAIGAEGRLVFHRPFVASGPGPIAPPPSSSSVAHYKRLVVSSWDSGSYILHAMRGFSLCPGEDLSPAHHAHVDYAGLIRRCNVTFFPLYGQVGGWISRLTHIPVDWSLFLLTVACAIGALYLLTSPAIVSAVGATQAVLAVYLFAIFPGAFYMATVLTEAPMLLCAVGAFVALRRKRYLLGGCLAGIATALHFRGIGVGAAYGAALVVSVVTDMPRTRLEWARRVAAALTCCSGVVALFAFYAIRFHDPLIYFHAVMAVRWVPPGADGTAAYSIMASLKAPYAGPMIAMLAVLSALGARSTLRDFWKHEQVYLAAYTAFLLTAIVSRGGDWLGLPRYIASVFPIFLVLARTFRGRTTAVVIWTILCLLDYWHIELCWFIGQQNTAQCLFSRYP
jgi:hypothetical protein